MRSMSWEERAIFDWLLDEQWVDGGLPDDHALVSNMIGAPVASVSRVLELAFVRRDDGLLWNDAGDEVRLAQLTRRQAKTEASAKGGRSSAAARRAKSLPAGQNELHFNQPGSDDVPNGTEPEGEGEEDLEGKGNGVAPSALVGPRRTRRDPDLPAGSDVDALAAFRARDPKAKWGTLVLRWRGLVGGEARLAIEVGKASAWLAENPGRDERVRKTSQFLGNWMRRAADQAPDRGAPRGGPPASDPELSALFDRTVRKKTADAS